MKGIHSSFVDRKTHRQYPLWQNRQPLISRLDIELTERCNNNCIHCFINLPQKDRHALSRELTTIQWESILRQAAELGALTVRFTGGEPLLRRDFPEIYIFARKLGLKILLFTNARLIDTRLARLLSRIPPMEKIEVTVYGMSRKTYEAVSRVPGSYNEFKQGVKLLEENQIPFIVKGVQLPANAGDMGKMESWAATLPWMDHPVDFTVLMQLRGRRNSTQKNRRIEKLRASVEEILRMFKRYEQDYIQGLAKFCSQFVGIKGDVLFSCSAGENGCVDAYGCWQPCLSLKHPALSYNLLTGSLKEALTEHFQPLKKLKAQNPEFLKRCARCFLRGLCEQCPAWSWSEHGNLDTPVEYLCQIAHAWAQQLGFLFEGEKGWETREFRQRIKTWVGRLGIDPDEPGERLAQE